MSSEYQKIFRATCASPAVPLFLLAILTLFTYGDLLSHQFLVAWDDPEYVTLNPAVRGFSWENVKRACTATYVGNYVPVQIISYMLDYSLWGMNPAGFLLANICYHFSSGIIFYLLLVRLGISKAGAAVGSAIFLIHPVQMESVAWISQRKNLLAMLFFLMAFSAYTRYREQSAGTARRWYAASLACALLSLLAKPVAVIIPLVLMLYDYCYPSPLGRKVKLTDKIPFALAAAAVGVLTLLIQSADWSGGREQYPYQTFIVLPLTMLTILSRYLQLLFWPVPSQLSILYQVQNRTDFDSAVVAAVIIFVFLSCCGIYAWRKNRPVFFWYALFFVGLLPVSQIVPLVTKMNDRYLYFPMLGIAGLTGYAVHTCQERLRSPGTRRFAAVTAITLVIGLAMACHLRGRVWQDTITLFGDAVTKAPRILLSWVGLANGYEAAGDFERALQLYEKGSRYGALSINDSFKLATFYLEQGEYDKANRHYLSLRMKTLGPGGKKDGLLLLGEYQGMIGNYDEAEKLVRKYLARYPDSRRGLESLGKIYTLTNKQTEAAEYFDRASRLGAE